MNARGMIYLILSIVIISFLIQYLWPLLLLLFGYLGYQYYRLRKVMKQETSNLQQDLFYEQVQKKKYEGEVIDAEYEEKEE